MKMIAEVKSKLSSNRRLSDLLFILWAGGAALLSYSLVYALRKPFTAATFDGIEAFGLDYSDSRIFDCQVCWDQADLGIEKRK